MPRRRERSPTSLPSKDYRLQELFRRLAQQPPFASLEDAYYALVSTLEEVEDELTGIENNPANWKVDGRLYPPQQDHWSPEQGHPQITRMRTRGHYILIAENGAIEVQETKTEIVVFFKAGVDGRKVWDP